MMSGTLRGLGILLIVPFLTACGGGLTLPPESWTIFYQAQLGREKAIGMSRALVKNQTNLDAAEAQFREADTQLRSATEQLRQNGMLSAPCVASGQLCAAADQLKPKLTDATTVRVAARAALDGMETAQTTAVGKYDTARAQWNAWIGTVILIIAADANTVDWPQFRAHSDLAIAGATDFFAAAEDSLRVTAQQDLRNRLNVFADAAQALNQDTTAALKGPLQEAGPLPSGSSPTGGAPGGGGGLGFDPSGILGSLFSVWKDLEAARQQEIREARARVIQELQLVMWPDYECIAQPSSCRSPATGGSSPPKGTGEPQK